MKRLILVDGNNLIFRSYFATAYSGNTMKNSKGFSTNALYGFVNMINKIILEEKPEYMLVAFDKGKSFRHAEYKEYKQGRSETPKELLEQIPISKELLKYMGIKYYEIDNYEADDIIGTTVKMTLNDTSFDSRIISSDRDLLQLLNYETDMKLLKMKDHIIYTEKSFKEEYKVDPIKIIDLKSLEGDKSDNIPGVKGIGEKTALSLIQEYASLEGVYENIEKIKGATGRKLVEEKEQAFFSKYLATIYTDVPVEFTLDDLKLGKEDTKNLINLYEELEFYSLIKKNNLETKESEDTKIVYKKITKKEDLNIKDASYYIETDNSNYHKANIIGIGICDKDDNLYYLTEEGLLNNKNIIDELKYTYDLKKNIVILNKIGLELKNTTHDEMIASYLLNVNLREDIAYLMKQKGIDTIFHENLIKKNNLTEEEIEFNIVKKAKFIKSIQEETISSLKKEELYDLYNNIEFPLISVLANMEMEGIRVSKQELSNTKEELEIKLELISNTIFNYSGYEFNISSPKQLGEILFDKLNLPTSGKKGNKHGYSTSHDVLVKLIGKHPVIEKIIEYRNLAKLLNTYVDTLPGFILEDGKVHTIYKQTITRTGRLSSAEPNLQNIPVRNELGREIRKIFIPDTNSIMLTSDYSQIELRVLAHISGCENLINAFNHNEDIHTKVASDIYGIPIADVTKDMRRTAKAVIFGIVYGISGYGLSENLEISPKDAKEFIEKYLTFYPGVKEYMIDVVKQAKETKEVRTLMNRKRVIEELGNANYMIRQSGERMALNTPIQGTSADIIKKAMIEIYNEFKKRNLKSKMILQVHDELIFNVVNDEIEDVKKLVKSIMEKTYDLKVPLKVEIDTGKNWYEAN